MAVDALTLFGIVAALFCVAVILLMLNSRHRRTQQRLNELHAELHRLHNRPELPTRATRDLCCAIRRIYPQALPGVDYHLADEGQGPYIAEWLMDSPQPDQGDLDNALKAHRSDTVKNAYRESRRMAYPKIEDQLDALYWARHGDTRELEALDETIKAIKERFPKPADCEESCS